MLSFVNDFVGLEVQSTGGNEPAEAGVTLIGLLGTERVSPGSHASLDLSARSLSSSATRLDSHRYCRW